MNIKQTVMGVLPEAYYRKRMPKSVVIEPTNMCNLHCLFCPQKQETRKMGVMKIEDFKKIVNMLPKSVKNISMNFSGEPLINRDIFKMSHYAYSKGIKVYISTNATLLKKFSSYEILSSGVDHISVCLDGANKGTHEEYRIGSVFEHVRENIRWLCTEKRKHMFQKPVPPKITMQTLLNKHNEHEIDDIIRLARELGVDELYLRMMCINNTPKEKRIEFARKYLPTNEEMSMYHIKGEKVIIKSEPRHCYSLFEPVILWNGDVTICCFDYNGEHVYGNILEEGFNAIWARMPRRGILNKRFALCREKCELSSDIDYRRIDFR